MSDHFITGNTVLGCSNCRAGHQLLQK